MKKNLIVCLSVYADELASHLFLQLRQALNATEAFFKSIFFAPQPKAILRRVKSDPAFSRKERF